MTSITNTPASYYQLSSVQNGGSSSLTGNNNNSGNASSITQSLINALQSIDGSSNNSSGNGSDILDLSPAAQALLNNASSSQSSNSSSTHFTLTQAQERQINEILAKYKDAPLTQDTFNKIQNDLEAAGLGADQLSAKDQVSSLNLTSSLLDALSGKNDPLTSASDKLSTEQTKANNYMKDVYSLWQQITSSSTTA